MATGLIQAPVRLSSNRISLPLILSFKRPVHKVACLKMFVRTVIHTKKQPWNDLASAGSVGTVITLRVLQTWQLLSQTLSRLVTGGTQTSKTELICSSVLVRDLQSGPLVLV